MKKKKTKVLILGAVAAAIVAAVLCLASIPGKTGNKPEETTKPDETASDALVIDNPDTSKMESEETEPVPVESESETADESGMLCLPDEPAPPVNTGAPAGDAGAAAGPVADKTPIDDGDGGVTFGGDAPEPYSCGTPGHHCDGPETHAFIQNLEIEGCPYCGSHSCPSFYATDEWGNACYTPSKCPKYDVHKDPVFYCQECGKPCGDGKNGTCVQFVEACYCPNCGKWVEAWICHSCD